MRQDASDDFIRLPDKFEINEWSIMERFAQSLDNRGLREDLVGTIRGRGAFLRFKSFTMRHGLRDAWHKFRTAALTEMAIEFLEEQQIPFVRD